MLEDRGLGGIELDEFLAKLFFNTFHFIEKQYNFFHEAFLYAQEYLVVKNENVLLIDEYCFNEIPEALDNRNKLPRQWLFLDWMVFDILDDPAKRFMNILCISNIGFFSSKYR